MKRRGFLGLLGAAVAAPFVPMPVTAPLQYPDLSAFTAGVLTPNEARDRLARIPVTGSIVGRFHCDDRLSPELERMAARLR